MAEPAASTVYDVKFPQELIQESRRVPKPSTEQLSVEGWRGSWLSRLAETLVGRDKD